MPDSQVIPWTARQRAGLAALLLGVLLILLIRASLHSAYVTDPQPAQGARAGELSGRVDPNSAPGEELAALPLVGESLARRIVEQRERIGRERPGQIPFRRPEDLLQVKGIGRAMLQTLEPHLAFPEPASNGQASAERP